MNKKKILCFLLLLLIVPFIFTGCAEDKSKNYKEDTNQRFVIIERVKDINIDGYKCNVYIGVDKETKIMYYFFFGYYKFGVETILNPDGTPKIYDKEL